MKQIFIFYFLCLLFGIDSVVYSQVSSTDRKLFADNLNAGRKITNLGVSPHSDEYISIVFDGVKYSGVRVVSNELMLKAFSNISYATLLNLFDVMGTNEKVFNQFLYQVFLYNEGNKSQIIRSLKSFCSIEQLADRIYTKFWGKYSSELSQDIAKNRAERKQIEVAKSKDKSISNNEEDSTKISTPINIESENIDEYEPEFPGGQTAYINFIQKNFKIPDSAVDINGTVIVEFIIDTAGKVRDAKVISSPLGYGLETEALRVINLLPTWLPARKGNISKASTRKQSFNF